MGVVCLVVHAEGPGELGHPPSWVAPRHRLPPDALGPAHVLVRRVLRTDRGLPEGAVEFQEPLRTATGTRPRGSHLLTDRVLDEVLAAWGLAPPLIVLLVDADNIPPHQRQEILRRALERNLLQGAVGVAVKEFESWLSADPAALRAIFGSDHDAPPAPEALDPGQVKSMLGGWTTAVPGRTALDVRCELAATVDLDTLTKRCPSFAAFRKELTALDLG